MLVEVQPYWEMDYKTMINVYVHDVFYQYAMKTC